jgi:hypothetical protein
MPFDITLDQSRQIISANVAEQVGIKILVFFRCLILDRGTTAGIYLCVCILVANIVVGVLVLSRYLIVANVANVVFVRVDVRFGYNIKLAPIPSTGNVLPMGFFIL